jgi:hypothetical protein
MASLFPELSVIRKLKVPPTDGELYLCNYLNDNLGEDYHVFFNPYLDGDRPDLIILKKNCGAIIIEVKDWNLDFYSIDSSNQWSVESSRIRSPFVQVFKYKSNFFDLHLPTLGLKEALDKEFFKVITCYVYFHLGTKSKINSKYDNAISIINDELSSTHKKFKDKIIQFKAYENKCNYLEKKKFQLNRDQRLSITKDNADTLLNKIKNIAINNRFSDEIYEEFSRRLMPPAHVLTQGIELDYDAKQLKLIESKDEFKKVKGVAGCGKTSIIAKRSVNAYARHQSPVLILTFNITLKHYIKDKISDVRRGAEFNNFEITNYHQFFNAQINNLNIDTSEFLERLKDKGLSNEDTLDLLYKTDFFQNTESVKYQTIYIDEIQDYESEWVKIVKNNFLIENGEMILFGDQSQNIYERDNNKRESSIVNGFGRWVQLTKSYRSNIDSPLVNLFKAFQMKYLVEKYQDSEIFDTSPDQNSMNFDILKYATRQSGTDNIQPLFLEIVGHIKNNNLVPNDIVIICSNISILREINELFSINEKTMIMFETIEEYAQIIGDTSNSSPQEIKNREQGKKLDIDKIRRRKKSFFMQNSGLIKLSTIHSFKGLESPTVFCILLKDDNPEIVYTALTRAKDNLIIFDVEDSSYFEFFKNNLV